MGSLSRSGDLAAGLSWILRKARQLFVFINIDAQFTGLESQLLAELRQADQVYIGNIAFEPLMGYRRNIPLSYR